MKKAFLILLCVCLLAAPLTGCGETGAHTRGLAFKIENGEAIVTGYSGSETNVVIPAVYRGRAVTAIADSAFSGNGKITSVAMPDSLKAIGKQAFFWCESLRDAALPAGVTEIGDSAFYACALETAVIPEGVTSLGSCVFGKCEALTSAAIPAGVTEIWNTAFDECEGLVIDAPADSYAALWAVKMGFGTTNGSSSVYNLAELVESGLAEVTVTPNGISSSTVTIKSLSDKPFLAEIGAGTYLRSGDFSVQDMLVTSNRYAELSAGNSLGIELDTACMNIGFDIPTSSSVYSVAKLPDDDPLVGLLEVIAGRECGYPTIQAAVWIITDGASYEDCGTLVGPAGRAIQTEAYEEALALVEEAKSRQ